MFDRRGLLAGLGAAAVVPLIPPLPVSAAVPAAPMTEFRPRYFRVVMAGPWKDTVPMVQESDGLVDWREADGAIFVNLHPSPSE